MKLSDCVWDREKEQDQLSADGSLNYPEHADKLNGTRNSVSVLFLTLCFIVCKFPF
jgi:hypothetical protein